jgi:opacity protein-like surface antigen
VKIQLNFRHPPKQAWCIPLARKRHPNQFANGSGFQVREDIVVHKLAAVAFALLLLTTVGYAQVPGGNVFIGYSYMSADLASGSRSNLNGWNGSVEGKVLPFVGIVADFSGHYGSGPVDLNPACTAIIGGSCTSLSTSTNVHNFLFGPRVSVSVGKIRPFAHALFGAGHISTSAGFGLSSSDTSFAYALGGGVDYHLIPLISWRVQADWLQDRFFSNTQNNVRISTGIAIRF